MKSRNFEDNLALIAALIVLLGVSFAAEDALAKNSTGVTSTALAIHNAAESTLVDAAEANVEAVTRAVESLAQETCIDLDIKLGDRTSTLMASKK
jgi:hypothetical protein